MSDMQTAKNDLSVASLRSEFALYEHIEQFPLFLGNIGMAHRVAGYFRGRHKGEVSWDGPSLGPFGVEPMRLVGSQAIPGVLGQRANLQNGQGLAVMESSLVRATIFRHQPLQNDFLLVRQASRGNIVVNGKIGAAIYLRRISQVCAVGQAEPLVEICHPYSRQSHAKRRRCARHMVDCARKRLKTKNKNDDDRMVDDVIQWWPRDDIPMVRAEHRASSKDDQDTSLIGMVPEDICVLESMERGLGRLRDLGFKDLQHHMGGPGANKSLRIAVDELEELGKRRFDISSSMTRRARWIVEKLDIAPWHTTHEQVETNERLTTGRRVLFAISGLGDSLGHRGEAISFMRCTIADIPGCLEMASLQKLNNRELREALERDTSDGRDVEHLSRYERLLVLRDRNSRDSDPRHDPRQAHGNLVQEVFDRQVAALGSEKPAMTDDENEPEVDRSNGHSAFDANGEVAAVRIVPGVENGLPEQDLLDDLEADMFDEFEAELSKTDEVPGALNSDAGGAAEVREPTKVNGSATSKRAREEDDSLEMSRLRGLIGEEKALAPISVAPAPAPKLPASRKISQLRVVSVETGPAGKLVERVVYIFGDDIPKYRQSEERRKKQLEQTKADLFAEEPSETQVPVTRGAASSLVSVDPRASGSDDEGSMVSSAVDSLISGAMQGPSRAVASGSNVSVGPSTARSKRLRLN